MVAIDQRTAPAGASVSDDDASERESLEERIRKANSNLQGLIESVGELLEASTELLGRLQRILTGPQPAADGAIGSDETGTRPPTDRRDC
jgi:hypothetical protein